MSDPDTAASTKNKTQTTEKRGNVVNGIAPVSAQHPYPDPTNPAQDRDGPPPLGRKDVKSGTETANGSPRSINMKATPVAPKSGQERPSRSSRRHRKILSEDAAFKKTGHFADGDPNQRGVDYPPIPYQNAVQTKPGSFESGGTPPRQSSGHIRHNSLPQASKMMPPPVMGYPPAGAPPIAMNPETGETGPLLPYARTSHSGSYRKRKPQAGSRTSGPVLLPGVIHGVYGSFEDGEDMVPPPPQTRGSYRQENFSPRDEFMSLTGAVPSTRKTSPKSPARKGDMAASPYGRMPPKSPTSSLRSPGDFPRTDDVRVSFSPGTPMQDEYTDQAPGLSPYLHSPRSSDLYDSTDSPFSSSRRMKKPRSPHPHHKMHMRQMSAQLFMEDSKGVEQPVACRDVLFFLLFVIHLIGIFFLGSTYSRDALMVNQTGDEWTVNVWYLNVIVVASLCGAFAVALSTLTLIIMTVFVRRLVQVSLILIIALSFAWGTIGIGVSPKNIVPISGIVAFTLSVGYAFVVWDRIPFAAANLSAGLTGVRRNAGTILVAFAFQFLAVAWSIYYTFVVIGVYDALNNGQLNLSKHATVFVYSMLFVSYYWTYSVLLVRQSFVVMKIQTCTEINRCLTYHFFSLSACCTSYCGRRHW